MPQDNSANSKRIAKNTLLLYFRMIFLMLISLYTSRITLQALGVTDYGLNNVVGGVVGIFSVISGSLSASISRFITFEIGEGDMQKLKRVFSTSVNIQFILAGIILILIETIGLWFMHHKMVIPPDRMYACEWVFQFAIISFCVNLISVPYNACIIAHEKMSAFAYISIFDGLFKLAIVYLIQWCPFDRLIFYSSLLLLNSLIDRAIYGFYCAKKFEECKYQKVFDKTLLKDMFGFAGWNFIGASSAVLRDQGGNIVINMFSGPAVNAARGIAMSINNAVVGFANNFMTALNPQITKSYASGDFDYMFKLIYQGARLSFYMLLLLSLPIIMNTQFILQIWLGQVPEHSALFAKLVLVFAMSEAISNPLVTAMLATGKIRNYQIVVGGLQMMNLPISYICLRFGAIPETVLIVAICISQCCLAARLVMLRGLVHLKPRDYIKKVYLNLLKVTACAALFPILLYAFFGNDTWLLFCANVILCVVCTALVEYFIGCSPKERHFVVEKAIQFKHKFLKK
ncbi:MAG: lipopolysaccharide biosynthesis protein [Prevotella sp.]|nr:lipopolysaccharide biosynthesis protein [Prevotella sp.]